MGLALKLAGVALTALFLVGCAMAVDEPDTPNPGSDTTTSDPPNETTTTAEAIRGGAIDLSLGRQDVSCTPEDLGDDEIVQSLVAHQVVEGNLGGLCLGTESELILDAWEILADIVPPGQLWDLAVFSGFESLETGDETTLAFVAPFDDEGSEFQMSINLDQEETDESTTKLTLVHEFAHVFSGTVIQIDRLADAADCDTFYNGDGCFYDDSLVYMWIQDFWTEYIDDIDPDISPSVADGEERCDLDPGFLGPYAASHPEEDFAESFSAYVLQVEASNTEQRERIQWFEQFPGLVEFRERAVAAGHGPLVNEFEVCGS